MLSSYALTVFFSLLLLLLRYAQFFSTQSSHGRWRQGQSGRASGQVRSASVESLLEPPELLERQQQRQQAPSFLRNRSTSTPQTLEVGLKITLILTLTLTLNCAVNT